MIHIVRSCLIVLACVAFASPAVWSQTQQGHTMEMPMMAGPQWTSARPDGHAPVGVKAGNTHHARKWMFSYLFMFMEMDGNRDRTDRIGTNEVLRDFPVTPTRMTMQMHMAGVMYAPTHHLTLMAMFPFIRMSMDHVTRTNVKFTTESSGVGDLKLTALYILRRIGRHRFHLNAGLSFPTGSIDEKDDTPAGPNQKLPYPMQLGSGTFDLFPGITYLGQTENWSWGGQAMGMIRLGENDNEYTLGNRYLQTGWVARRWTEWLSTSARLDWQIWGNIDGADPDLNPAVVPTADPDRRGRQRLDLLFGANLYAPKGKLSGHRLSIEGGFPIYQDLDGPQLETDWQLFVGWRWTPGNL